MAEGKLTRLWNETFRPVKIEDYIFQTQQQKILFSEMAAQKEIPNLLLSGPPGCGKTTLSKILVNACEIDQIDILVINASKETSVDVMREKITNFVQCYAMSKFKIVQLEECDYLSLASQAALRYITEEFSDNARFIGTCNYVNKLTPPLRSRFQQYEFKSPIFEDVLLRLAEILVTENIEFDLETLNDVATAAYPDIRAIINLAQQYSSTGKLLKVDSTSTGDYRFQILDLLKSGNFPGIRKVVCENATKEEYEDLYRFMYTNIGMAEQFASKQSNYEQAIVMIANYLYRHSIIADPEINFAALCFELATLK